MKTSKIFAAVMTPSVARLPISLLIWGRSWVSEHGLRGGVRRERAVRDTQRDLLVRLAMTGRIQAKWTNRILDEMARNLAANRPDIPVEKLGRLRRLMNAQVIVTSNLKDFPPDDL